MTKCSVYHILVGKAVAGFERTDSNSERNSTVKGSSSLVKGKSQCSKPHCCRFKKLAVTPQASAATTLTNQQPQHRDKTLHQKNDYDSLKAQIVSIFSNILIKLNTSDFRH